MIQEMFPNAKTVGLLYCSAEPNSVYQCDVIEGYLTEMGLETTRYAFTDTNDVTSVTQAAAAASDVIYIPTDNTAASNTEAIANVVIPEKVPVVAGEEGICKGCGLPPTLPKSTTQPTAKHWASPRRTAMRPLPTKKS